MNPPRLETAIKAVDKLSDGGGTAKASLEAQLQDARKALAECKPALTQHTNTGHKLARAVAKRKQLGNDISEQQLLLQQTQEKLDSLRAHQKVCDKEIAEFSRQLVLNLPGHLGHASLNLDEVAPGADKDAVSAMLQSDAFQKYKTFLEEQQIRAATAATAQAAPSPFDAGSASDDVNLQQARPEPPPARARSPFESGNGARDGQPVPGLDVNDPDLQDLFFSAQRVEKREWSIKLQELLAKRQRCS